MFGIADVHKAFPHSRKGVKSWAQLWITIQCSHTCVIQEIMGLKSQTRFPLVCFPKRTRAQVCSASLNFFKSISLNSWCVLSNYNICKQPWSCHKRGQCLYLPRWMMCNQLHLTKWLLRLQTQAVNKHWHTGWHVEYNRTLLSIYTLSRYEATS